MPLTEGSGQPVEVTPHTRLDQGGIIRHQEIEEPAFHLLVREVQPVTELGIIPGEGEVTTLEKHGDRIRIVFVHPLQRGLIHIKTFQVLQPVVILLQESHQECGCPRSEPIITECQAVKRVQQTIWIIDSYRIRMEVITVVSFTKFRASLLTSYAIGHGQLTDRPLEVSVQFLFRDTANVHIPGIHGNVFQIVQVAENADVAETAYPREESKADVRILRFQYPEEAFEGIAIGIVQFLAVNGTQQGLVVLIHQDYHLLARLFASTPDDALETQGQRDLVGIAAIKRFPVGKRLVQHLLQVVGGVIGIHIQVQVQHGICLPLRFQPFQSQALEEFLLAQEIGLQRGYQQGLAKAARTTQEIILPLVRQLVNQGRLVHVHVTNGTNILKTLYAYRVLHDFSF